MADSFFYLEKLSDDVSLTKIFIYYSLNKHNLRQGVGIENYTDKEQSQKSPEKKSGN